MTRKPAITHKITPHLWFDKEAREAAEFYTDLFPKSKIKSTTTLNNTPSGTVEVVTIDLMGQEFMLLSAGPLFKFNDGHIRADLALRVCRWSKRCQGSRNF